MLQTFANLLAQSPAPTTQPTSPGPNPMFIGLIVCFGIFYFVMIRGNRKQKQERANLLDNLAKNDRVMTIGGLLGTIVTVRDQEVVLKVDESTNTKVTFLKSSIQRVITDGDLSTPEK
ncbi:MAG TPA: preprotein translocase subunit YajC [Phycisphaerae bacterium]|nr:preprotein translocase subunit YajC [Phycisphaerales bacterium]HNO78564.1 preprotein translocase subunit YajC [Phycisphaerae bacterium]